MSIVYYLWVLLKAIIEDYIFLAENSEKTGEDKKKEVIDAINKVIDAIAPQLKISGIIISIIKLLIPFLIDVLVAKYNIEGIFNHNPINGN